MADLFALVYVMFSCVFVTFPYGVLGQVWYLIVSMPEIGFLPCFEIYHKAFQILHPFNSICIAVQPWFRACSLCKHYQRT